MLFRPGVEGGPQGAVPALAVRQTRKSMIKPLLELTNTPGVDTEYTLACQFLGARMKDTSPPDEVNGPWEKL